MDNFSTANPSSKFSSLLPNRSKEKKKDGKRSRGVKLSTDPQSVAARERRHKISDRFKMLQSLVPGGNKMDTVSMLEEAIHYVKFLQTQIWLHQTMIIFFDADSSCLDLANFSFPNSQRTFINAENSLAEKEEPSTPVPLLPNSCFQSQETLSNLNPYVKYYC